MFHFPYFLVFTQATTALLLLPEGLQMQKMEIELHSHQEKDSHATLTPTATATTHHFIARLLAAFQKIIIIAVHHFEESQKINSTKAVFMTMRLPL
jgi:hypothetical protein